MRDPRITELAHNLITFSVNLQKGEKILIESVGATEMVKALVEEVYRVGGQPFVELGDPEINRVLYAQASEEQFQNMAKYMKPRMEDMDAWIGIRASANASEMSGVPAEKMNMYSRYVFSPIHHDIRVAKTKWCIIRWPNASMAQSAGTYTDDFEDFFFKVCNLDYSKMSKAMEALVARMNRTDRVRLVAKDTDLSFSIKDIPAIKCDGHMNIPDGEVYTAPVRDSINGIITYNTPAEFQGTVYENISFTFKDGKIVEAKAANDTEKLNKVLDMDEGSRYVGEFAIGVHPNITEPMMDTLFDEKISGSIHFTPGSCYEDAYNGNKSGLHWDLVLIMRPEYGGGEIYFDDELIRKDGKFVVEDLKCLDEL